MARRKFEFFSEQRMRLPNGASTKISYVKHPGAVIIVPFLSREKIVFLRQYRPVIGKYLYELPAGTIDPGEPAAVCARRELIEETGLRSRNLRKVGQIHPVPGYSTEIIHIYKAQDLQQGQAQPEDYELIRTLPMGKAEVRKLFLTGKLTDAKSICALCFCAWL